MTKLNKKIAEALDMRIPDEENSISVPVLVEPHEVVVVENSDLPQMEDINKRLLEGEKQLETVIEYSLDRVTDIKDGIQEVEPKFRGRMIEAENVALQIALDAIKHKTDLQLKKKESRMKEAAFQLPNKTNQGNNGVNTTNNIIFTGSREELLRMMHPKKDDE